MNHANDSRAGLIDIHAFSLPHTFRSRFLPHSAQRPSLRPVRAVLSTGFSLSCCSCNASALWSSRPHPLQDRLKGPTARWDLSVEFSLSHPDTRDGIRSDETLRVVLSTSPEKTRWVLSCGHIFGISCKLSRVPHNGSLIAALQNQIKSEWRRKPPGDMHYHLLHGYIHIICKKNTEIYSQTNRRMCF